MLSPGTSVWHLLLSRVFKIVKYYPWEALMKQGQWVMWLRWMALWDYPVYLQNWRTLFLTKLSHSCLVEGPRAHNWRMGLVGIVPGAET